MKTISNDKFTEIFPLFKESPASLVSEILAIARYQAFPKDILIYSEGDSCSAIAFILSGEIRVYKTGATGREITLYEIGKGDTCILNASCILSDMSYPANAVSVEAGEMLLFPAADFRRLIEKYEDVRNFVFNLLTRRLTSVMTLVEEVAFGRMDERLINYLRERAVAAQLDTTHQDIANDLGTSREVISRLLKDFEREGRIVLSRSLIQLKRV